MYALVYRLSVWFYEFSFQSYCKLTEKVLSIIVAFHSEHIWQILKQYLFELWDISVFVSFSAYVELIKGLIDMNLGEPIEEFEKPSTVIRDPIAQVNVCTCT